MGSIDKHDRLKVYPFDYSMTKKKIMMIYYENKHIMTLNSKDSLKLEMKLGNTTPFNQQLLLAKVTGNFKRGNER